MPNVMDDYITVAQRIERFYEKYPEGSLQSRIVELTEDRVVMEASAYRTADDERPGIGYSSMPIPARNQMLRDSEIETCETSAWGRAIAALGFEVKKAVASQNEIDAKRSSERNPRVGAADYEPPPGPVRDGIIGVAKKGTKNTSDAELRQTPDGYVLGFRLEAREGDRGGILVEAHDDIASALAAVSETWLNQTVTCWGSIEPKEFKPARSERIVKYNVLMLSRIQTSEFTLPAPDPSGPSDSPSLTGGTGAEPEAAGGESEGLAAKSPVPTPAAADEQLDSKAAVGVQNRPAGGMFDR